MGRILSKKKVYFVLGAALLAFFWFRNGPEEKNRVSGDSSRTVTLLVNGLALLPAETEARTVGEFLAEQKVMLEEKDYLFPGPEIRLSSRTRIFLAPARKISIREGKKKTEAWTTGLSVREALSENGVDFGADDLVTPGLGSLAREGEKVEIIRVEIKMDKESKKIDFKKNITEDPKLGWQEKKVTQSGKYGEKEITYRAVYHDGKLISRKISEERIIREPVEEIAVQGTYVKLGKKHDGMASWYAFKGGLFAANPWLPMGSYVKVTNLDNGKSVIVKINDRGPFVPGRIIDLDKVAFQKIASLGAGVVHIKMEEILN